MEKLTIVISFLFIGIGVVVLVIFSLVTGCIVYRKCRMNRRNNNRRNHINNGTNKDNMVLNSTRVTNADFKRSSKLSNLEVSQVSAFLPTYLSEIFLQLRIDDNQLMPQREPLTCPARPVSFTPSTHHEQYIAATLNNLDTMRSYGSAGDELENVPPDYLRNLNRQSPLNVIGAPNAQLPLSDMSKLNNGMFRK